MTSDPVPIGESDPDDRPRRPDSSRSLVAGSLFKSPIDQAGVS